MNRMKTNTKIFTAGDDSLRQSGGRRGRTGRNGGALSKKRSKKRERCTTKEVHEIWYILRKDTWVSERGERMRYLVGEVRGRRGVSLRRLARQVQISKSYLQRIEAGEAKPSLEVMVRIGQGLGVSLDELYRLE